MHIQVSALSVYVGIPLLYETNKENPMLFPLRVLGELLIKVDEVNYKLCQNQGMFPFLLCPIHHSPGVVIGWNDTDKFESFLK